MRSPMARSRSAIRSGRIIPGDFTGLACRDLRKGTKGTKRKGVAPKLGRLPPWPRL
jgi:hypothetical protein